MDRGEAEILMDGEKVKLCRGVNSFVTTADGKGESYQKIKIIDAMDMIADDIRLTAQDSYIGKYANSYDNKCLLVTAINGYFNTLISDKVLGSGSCKINVEAQRNFFVSQGGKLVIVAKRSMWKCSDDDIKRGNTKSKVSCGQISPFWMRSRTLSCRFILGKEGITDEWIYIGPGI